MEARRQVQQMVNFLTEKVPGFADAYLSTTGTQIGVRESRRILGEYTLTAEDVLGASKFADGIASLLTALLVAVMILIFTTPRGPERLSRACQREKVTTFPIAACVHGALTICWWRAGQYRPPIRPTRRCG